MMEQRESFQQMVLEQLSIHMPKKKKKRESRHRPYIFHKNYLNKDFRPKCRMQIPLGLKLLIIYFPVVIGIVISANIRSK